MKPIQKQASASISPVPSGCRTQSPDAQTTVTSDKNQNQGLLRPDASAQAPSTGAESAMNTPEAVWAEDQSDCACARAGPCSIPEPAK